MSKRAPDRVEVVDGVEYRVFVFPPVERPVEEANDTHHNSGTYTLRPHRNWPRRQNAKGRSRWIG